MSKFKENVYRIVKSIPKGKVVSYGQVALYAGLPRGARQVGWVLNQSKEEDNLPWWRVINNEGRLSIKGFRYSAVEQRELLIEEGVKVSKELSCDIESYRYFPDEKFLNSLELDSLVMEKIFQKISFSKGYFKK